MPEPSKKFAVFDIDGTLLRWQLFHAAIDRLGQEGMLSERAYSKLREARLHWKQRAHTNAFREYEEVLFATYFEVLPNLSTTQFDLAVEHTIQKYKSQVYTYTKTLAQNLKKQGYLLFAISGSHHELVSHIAKYYGFDDWQGSVYERRGTTFTGKRTITTHTDKHLLLKKLVAAHSATYLDSIGVGDTPSDISMLELTDHPIAFNPNHDLYEHARANGWKIVVERKNVIYTMEHQNGSYVLA